MYRNPLTCISPRIWGAMNSNLDSFYNKHAKRWCDAMAGAVLLTATSPVLAACAAAIKLDDGGPVFFHQRRARRQGAVSRSRAQIAHTMTVGTKTRSTAVTRPRRW